jgi:GT2 family glycosyltransferase
MSGEVDVVIVTYGGGADLPACVDAVRAQGEIGRVIVIDNASPDDTADRAEELDGVEVVRNGANVGYAAAMNQAYASTDAPFLLSLNADCVLGSGYVTACLSELRDDPGLAAVTGVLRLPDGRIDSSGISLSTAFVASDRTGTRPRRRSRSPSG